MKRSSYQPVGAELQNSTSVPPSCNPVATFDMVIPSLLKLDISNLDPNKPDTIRAFIVRIGSSKSAYSPPEPQSSPQVGYEADDEDCKSPTSCWGPEDVDQDGDLPMTDADVTNYQRKLFPVNPATGEFTNPFEALPSHARGEAEAPVSPLSMPFMDDGSPVSPLDTRFDRRESGVFGAGLSSAPVIREPDPAGSRFSTSRPSSSTASLGNIFSSIRRVLDEFLSQLLFDQAAHGFFSAFDVEGLLADQISGAYTLSDHDALHHPGSNLRNKWPYCHWLPHGSVLLRGRCTCRKCSDEWIEWIERILRDEELSHTHDLLCSCQECKQDFSGDEYSESQSDGEELTRSKRKFAEFEDGGLSAVSSEQEPRRKLRRETRSVGAAQFAVEAQRNISSQATLSVPGAGSSPIASPAQRAFEEDVGDSERSGCLCMGDMVKMLRRPSDPTE